MTRLDNLLLYQQQTRRIGHTRFMIEGLRFDRPGAILFASNSHAQMAFREVIDNGGVDMADFARMQIGQVRFATIGFLNNLMENMRGTSDWPPLLIDHFALQILIDEDRKEKEEAIRRSQTDHLFSVLRHTGHKVDKRAVMRLSKQWQATAKAEAERKLNARSGNARHG